MKPGYDADMDARWEAVLTLQYWCCLSLTTVLMWQIQLSDVTGTGKEGRILKDDIIAYLVKLEGEGTGKYLPGEMSSVDVWCYLVAMIVISARQNYWNPLNWQLVIFLFCQHSLRRACSCIVTGESRALFTACGITVARVDREVIFRRRS